MHCLTSYLFTKANFDVKFAQEDPAILEPSQCPPKDGMVTHLYDTNSLFQLTVDTMRISHNSQHNEGHIIVLEILDRCSREVSFANWY